MKNNLQYRYFKTFLQVCVLIIITIITFGCIRAPLENGNLTIGVLLTDTNSAEDYKDLKVYLEKQLRPSLGQALEVRIDAQKYSLEEVKNKIRSQEWDIAFTVSPAISVVAEDNKYEFIARMYPKNYPYIDAAIFVRNDSFIKGFDDLTYDTTIALGSFNNIPAFYMPVYYLYGKTIRVNKNNSLDQIIQMVELHDADVGAGVYNVVNKKSNLRIIGQTRKFPVAGVYFSPTRRISNRERSLIKKAFLNADQTIQEKANYIKSDKLDYQQFNQIVARVDEVLECTNWNQNPVNLFCKSKRRTPLLQKEITSNIQAGIIIGKINGYISINAERIRLNLQGQDGKVYSIFLTRKILNQISNAPSIQELNGKTLKVKNAQSKQREGIIELEITKPEQLEIL